MPDRTGNSALANKARRLLASRMLGMLRQLPESIAAEQSFLEFVYQVGRDDRGRQLEHDEYTKVFAKVVTLCWEQKKHLSHVAGPGLGKSTLARLFLLWLIGRDRNLRTVIVSGDKGVSQNSVSLCREIFLTEPYGRVFPEVRPDYEKSGDSLRGWRMDGFYVICDDGAQIADPTMGAVAMEPIAENRRVDVGLFDDYMTRAIANSTKLRTNAERTFSQTWLNRAMANNGWMLFISNCWTTEDLGHALRRNTGFCSFWCGVNADSSKMFVRLWNPPEGLSAKDFDAEEVTPQDGADVEFEIAMPVSREAYSEKATMNRIRNHESEHRQLFQLIATGPEDKILPHWDGRTRFAGTVSKMLGVEEVAGLPKFTYLDRKRFALAAGLDLSGLGRRGTAWCVLAIDANGLIYPVEMDRGAWGISQIVNRIEESWQRGIQPMVINVESNGLQELIMEGIASLSHERNYEWSRLVKPFVTGNNKWDPRLGFPALDVDFEQGIAVWPEGESSRKGLAHAQVWRLFETQGSQLTNELTRETTPDGWMAYWFARDVLRRVKIKPGPSMRAVKHRGSEVSY
jgi:hypothetical protein